MKSSIFTNVLLIVVAILLIVNLWATFSINRYHVVSYDTKELEYFMLKGTDKQIGTTTHIFRVDKLNGTYERVLHESWQRYLSKKKP